MFAQSNNLRHNIAAMFFAIVFSAVTVAAAVGPSVSATAVASIA